MYRSAVPAVQLSGVEMDAKLALAEFLLNSTDLTRSVQQAIDWLALHTGVTQAVIFVADPRTSNLIAVAEHGRVERVGRGCRDQP